MEKTAYGKSRPLTSFFSVDDVLILTGDISREMLIERMLEHLGRNYGFNNLGQYRDAVWAREGMSDTVVGEGIALPHARIDGIDRPYVCVSTVTPGVLFSEWKPLVRLIILVLIPEDTPDLYLQILKALSKILVKPDVAAEVAGLGSAEEVLRFFDRGGLILPDYVCAADIMNTHFDFLRENDSLRCAIDNFTSKNLSEIPVIDADGDMVGVVSAKALLRVCLPDYLLWMEDLSPIINFQPFVHVMKNEGNSWISDILTGEFPSVQMTSPAISVAGEMTRRDASVCYVLNGRKLMGIISLPLFLNKIFRE